MLITISKTRHRHARASNNIIQTARESSETKGHSRNQQSNNADLHNRADHQKITRARTTTTGDNKMIDVKYLVKRALAGDERAYRFLVSRYGKVITTQLLQNGARNADND